MRRTRSLRSRACDVWSRWNAFRTRPGPPDWRVYSSAAEFRRTRASEAKRWHRRQAEERSISSAAREFHVAGRCWVCDAPSSFFCEFTYALDDKGVEVMNWREHLKCVQCQLNNRMRGALHYLESILSRGRSRTGARVYVTEQCTPMFGVLQKRCPELVGSEYLGTGLALGAEAESGLRNENLAALTFLDAEFEFVLSLDVLEHVGALDKALRECHRVLQPGGALLFTVPFFPSLDRDLVRAVEAEDGAIRHLHPPVYHVDPLSEAGCLVFHDFGWQLLERIRGAGFETAELVDFWSREYGYYGDRNWLFVGHKARNR